jgi:alpha-glucosidase
VSLTSTDARKCLGYLALILLVMYSITTPKGYAQTGLQVHNIQLPGVGTISVEVWAPGVFRLWQPSGRADSENLMERYQIISAAESQTASKFDSTPNSVVITSGSGSLQIDRGTGRIKVLQPSGRVVSSSISLMPDRINSAATESFMQREEALSEMFRSKEDSGLSLGDPGREADSAARNVALRHRGSGFSITAKLTPEERLYGLGEASKSHIQLRGYAYYNWVRYQQDEQPVPFLMSTGGWGLFVNTAWRHYVDIGKTDPNELFVWAPEGDLDVFLIVGSGMPEMLNRYTALTGRATLLPMWVYGLTWINHINADQHEVLENAYHFRESHFPVDGFGLEPGWMKKYYDFSTKVEWNLDRFYEPDWLRGDKRSSETFIGALKRLGIKLHLWLGVDYDLTGEAEREVAVQRHQVFPPASEAYFEHLKSFLDDGVVAWKIDPARLVSSPDPSRQYTNHRSEYEMHNLNQVLIVKQIYEGQAKYTGLRPMIQYCGGWAGSQQYAAQTVGDIDGGPEGLAWMLNASLTGYMNTAADMRVYAFNEEKTYWPDGAGIHLGFLSAWTLIDGWAYPYQPWFAGEKLQAMMTDYAKLRYRLLPYLYSAAYNGYRTGMPIMRPLPLVYPNDPRLQDETHEYMLGDSLLVTTFTSNVRLPVGHWIDYWTGDTYEGPSEMPYIPPANRGGGLFVREGAIIPYAAPMDYVGQRSLDAVDFDIYPSGNSSTTLYEDDGIGFGYQNGSSATTLVQSSVTDSTVEIKVGARIGEYAGMPARRRIRLLIHGKYPSGVRLDDQEVSEGAAGWSYDRSHRVTSVELGGSATPVLGHHVVLYFSSSSR